MALTSQQIIALSLQDARVPGFTQGAGQLLNAILSEICETYNFEWSKSAFFFNLNPSLTPTNPNQVIGNGPYPLPSDYLRMRRRGVQYWFNGLPYQLVGDDEDEFDLQVQQIGIASLPRQFWTDVSTQPCGLYIYPPPNGAYAAQAKYQCLMPDIGSGVTSTNGWAAGTAAPEVSSVVPWFRNTTYLRTRLSGEIMRITGDKRTTEFLGKNGNGTGAQDILDRLLPMANDNMDRAQRVKLDQRRFGGASAYNRLPDTKNIFG